MQQKPITILQVLLISAGAGAVGGVVVFLALAGAYISNPSLHLLDFLADPKSYQLMGATFAIIFLSVLSPMLMMYWQQRQG